VRIGILASEMEGERTGVGRYIEGLATGLGRADFDGEVHLFFQGARFEHPLWSDSRFRLSFANEGGRSPVLWERRSLPARLAEVGLDAFLGPAYSLPPRLPCPALVALHDLSFEVLPQEFGWRERWRRRLLARDAARRASRVLTLSHTVARQIEERYGVAADRIDVLPLAVDEEAFAVDASVVDARIAPPYVLYLGTVLPRRRLDLVIEAFGRIARDRPDLKLAMAGANRLPQPEVLEDWAEIAGVHDRVIDLGWVPERDLPTLLAGAEATFYLSTYEGFGLPPIESLAAGTPPIVSRGLGLDDLWPDYPFRCERLEAGEIERVTRRALEDEALRREVAAKGRELVGTLRWEDYARRFLESARRARDDVR
jgi:glycosyltransferase involved in cell wall biosynthesis